MFLESCLTLWRRCLVGWQFGKRSNGGHGKLSPCVSCGVMERNECLMLYKAGVKSGEAEIFIVEVFN